MEISFRNIESERVKEIFREVASRFKPLHNFGIFLEKRSLTRTTMQAQPIINFKFFRRRFRSYVIHMSPTSQINEKISTVDLPESVLKGWFAHELGHLMDYKSRNWLVVASMGIGYVLFRNSRLAMEKRADMYALEFGFGQEILATKNFILSHAELSSRYKKQIMLYYLSPAEIERLIAEETPQDLEEKPIADLLP